MDRRQISMFLAALVVGLGLRGFVPSGPPDQLVTNVPDDALCYLETAKTIAAGEGSTLDDCRPVNGYHPFQYPTMWVVGEAIGQPSIIDYLFERDCGEMGQQTGSCI